LNRTRKLDQRCLNIYLRSSRKSMLVKTMGAILVTLGTSSFPAKKLYQILQIVLGIVFRPIVSGPSKGRIREYTVHRKTIDKFVPSWERAGTQSFKAPVITTSHYYVRQLLRHSFTFCVQWTKTLNCNFN